jgi:hypothetical protein
MAKEPGRKKSPDELRAQIDRSRELVERDLRDLRDGLDIPRKIRKSFRRQTGLWIAAVAVVGVLVAVQVTRKKKIYVETTSGSGNSKSQKKLLEAGFALGLVRLAVTLFRPMIVGFVTKKIGDYAGGASAKQWR